MELHQQHHEAPFANLWQAHHDEEQEDNDENKEDNDADEEEDRNLAAVPPLTFNRPPINEASSNDLLQRR